ncbi:MAG TPA: pimeloyl-[acyl-carrier protein] methyl ester esterase [Gammaproteobacteria bacterium]|nr:pimeloyl-[acyl-carrier protein] methyl ester esterase [Gammaproteobacteria bacterium]
MPESLYVDVRGQGPDLLLLHGWAMHGGIWPASLLAVLEQDFRLHIIDLPGHGRSAPLTEAFSLDSVSKLLYQYARSRLDGPACWLGWSLGGMLAANVAVQHPQIITRLVLVSSSLRFCKTENWPHAMDVTVLELFAAQLRQDYRGTLSRFLALQFKGDSHARESLRGLREQLFARGEPDRKTLNEGLKILLDDDLRGQANKISQPVQLIGGESDSLTPAAALEALARQFSQAKLFIIKGAGHAPFISHAEIFQQQLMRFVHVRQD